MVTTEPTTTETTTPPAPESGEQAVAIAKPAKTIHTEAELDQAITDVKRLKRDVNSSYWRLGIAIADIIDRQLWKLRTVIDDRKVERPCWKSFAEFCKSELQMTPKNAYDLAQMKHYQREEDVQLFGRTNATLILKAPSKARLALQARAAAGASTREIAREVNEARARENYSAPTPLRTAAATAAAAETKRKQPKLTIAKLLGSTLVPLYCVPLSGHTGIDTETIKKLTRARRDDVSAIGVFDLTDNVIERFTLSKDKRGALTLKIRRVRKKGDA